MVNKKSLIFLLYLIFLSTLVIAQEYKMEISVIPEDKIIEPGEIIKLKVTLYDLNNNLIKDKISIILKDLKETIIKETTIQSTDFAEIKIDEGIIAGEGKIIAKYKDAEAIESFFIAENELVQFRLDGEKLIITNIGNTIYEKKVYIIIGETTGTKTIKLNIGKSISYRLIAPEGVYNLKVTDGETTFTKGEVKLTGTGKTIGALDETPSKRSPVTGGIRPEEDEDNGLISYFKTSKFIYVFIIIVFGAMILLAIERKYRKKVSQ